MLTHQGHDWNARLLAGDETLLPELLEVLVPEIARELANLPQQCFALDELLDLGAEAVERMWRSRERFDPQKAPVDAWLRHIAWNLVANRAQCCWVKARELETGWAPSVLEQLPETLVPSSAEREEADEPADSAELSALRDALTRLPEPQRAVLMRDPLREVSSTLLAEEFGVAPSTVRWRWRMAMQMLRKVLQDLGFGSAASARPRTRAGQTG